MEIYQKLPLLANCSTIRLLQLRLVSNQNEDLKIDGEIGTYSLGNRPTYNALSYAWGSRDESARITLNGEVLAVSQTLFAALRQICIDQHKTGPTKKLWVDAICINQLDKAEKSQQVTRMRDIFAEADGVIAWLGIPNSLSNVAFDTLKEFAADDGTSNGTAAYQQIKKQDILLRRQAIDQFLEKSYFSRIWIVQEIVVGRTVAVKAGAHTIDFDRMLIAMNRMTGSGFYRFSPSIASLSYIGSWRRSIHETDSPAKQHFLDLRIFEDSRNRSATDPRDKLYALRGIANQTLGPRIKVDYNDSVEKVYTDFAKMVLKNQPDLQLLSAVYLRHRAMSKLNLPSYVPDWSLPKSGGGFLQRYYRFKTSCLFRASGTSVPRVSFVEGTSAIRIEGSRLDHIARVIPIKALLGAEASLSVAIDEDILKSLAATTLASSTYGFTGEPSWVAFFCTLTADRTALSSRIDKSYWSQYFASFENWGLGHSRGVVDNVPPAAWTLVSKDIGAIIEDKIMFVTGQGYLGLGHEGVRKGDLVCILSGGEVPFLFRETKKGANGDEFQFLCECYVHGIMDGEAVAKSSGRILEKFLIE